MEVERVMTRDVVVVAPSTSLRELARLLAARRISGVPVVADGTVLGVVSGTDLVRRTAGLVDGAPPTAGAAMSAPAVCIAADRPVAEAAALMLRRRVDRLPVLDRGRLVGIVTRADLVRAFARADAEVAADLAAALHGVDAEVADGDVTLRGVVPSRRTAAALAARAAAVPGVVSVVDRLIVASAAPRGRLAAPRRRAVSAPRRPRSR